MSTNKDAIPACFICGSANTEDCGDIGNGEHHIECRACGCAFPWLRPTEEETEPEFEGEARRWGQSR